MAINCGRADSKFQRWWHGLCIWLVTALSGCYLNSFLVLSPLFASRLDEKDDNYKYFLLSPYYVIVGVFGFSCFASGYVTESAGPSTTLLVAACLLLLGALLTGSGTFQLSFLDLSV